MAAIDLYYMPLSPPCRAALLTIRELKLELNLHHLDLFTGQHMTQDFIAMNPEHTVPTIKDGDFVLWESRAIMGYLVSKYGQGDWLYPQDAVGRAAVDRVLQFDMGTLYSCYTKYVMPVIFQDKAPDPAALKGLQEALGWLDGLLSGNKFAAGLTVTVADHCLAATVETIRQSKISLARFQNVKNWLHRCQETMPGYQENIDGAKIFGALVTEKMATATK